MTEQKYSLEPEMAVLGKDGLAEKAGWINVYHTNQMTREFTRVDIEYLMLGAVYQRVLIPMHQSCRSLMI
ncbi:hypothetical protein [Photorhabdus temperata]|uniref:hypothetical protein n=1 Tax=Photorhabdus temperata TaxID=574560 RepID=UPI000408BDA9